MFHLCLHACMNVCMHVCVYQSMEGMSVMVTSPGRSLNDSTSIDLLHGSCKLLHEIFTFALFFMASPLLIPMRFSVTYRLSDGASTPSASPESYKLHDASRNK